MKLTKQQRQQLYDKYNGKCAYCGCELPSRWHADHIEPIQRTWEFTGKPWNSAIKYTGMENQHLDCIENMNPSCPECNMSKGCFTVEQFREELSLQTKRALRESKNMRFALKYNQIKLTPHPIIFYFERFSERFIAYQFSVEALESKKYMTKMECKNDKNEN